MPWFWQTSANDGSQGQQAFTRRSSTRAGAAELKGTGEEVLKTDATHVLKQDLDDGRDHDAYSNATKRMPSSIIDPTDFTRPSTIFAALILTAALLYGRAVYKSRLQRISKTSAIPDSFWRKRSIFGRVLSVGDADNFRLYHTPGGFWTGFGWLRRIPTSRKDIYEETLHIRIAGIDAPELAHFGKPAQPHAEVALAWLKGQVHDEKVRCVLWRKDQYDRVVATVLARRFRFVPPMGIRWLYKDVGLEMLHSGWATVYEAKSGAEFGGARNEKIYNVAQHMAKTNRRGMWGGQDRDMPIWERYFGVFRKKPQVEIETPRQYKQRTAKQRTAK